MENLKTLAVKLGKTPNAVRQHFKKLIKNDPSLKSHVKTTTKHNKYHFDRVLSKIIINSFHESPNNEHDKVITQIQLQKILDHAKVLNDENKSLKIDKKNLTQSNQHLEKIVDHQQQLQMAITQKKDKLQDQVTHLQLQAVYPHKNHQHKHWWQRLFDK